jgi:chaperone required for assembly of F1-ATPase
MKSAQTHARPELPTRFYKTVTVKAHGDGHAVLLDGREVRTPARTRLVLPAPALAEAVAEEWRAQGERIDPATMPLTRIVNSALDGVAAAREQVCADIVRFADADLVCYRADGPESLVQAQQRHWDPLVRWARDSLGVQLVLAEGVMHVDQPAGTADRLAEALSGHDALRLAALHVMTTLTGSCIIAIAVAKGQLSGREAWAAAHVDEDWQIGQWGADAQAAARREMRWRDMEAAARIVALLRG